MAKTKRQVTLNDETIAALEQEGMGALSTGIELMYRDWCRGVGVPLANRPTTREKTLDLPDDDDPLVEYMHHPENPHANRNTAKRLHSEALKAKQAAQEAHDKPRRGFKAAIRDTLANPSMARQQPAIFSRYTEWLSDEEMITLRDEVASDPDGSIYRESQEWLAAERMRNAEKARDDARRTELMAQGMTKEEAVAQMFAERGQVQTLKLTEKACKGRGVFGTPADFSDALIKELNDYWEHHELPPDDEEVTEP